MHIILNFPLEFSESEEKNPKVNMTPPYRDVLQLVDNESDRKPKKGCDARIP